MRSADGQPLPTPLPGQYVVLRLQPSAGSPPLFRSYSLSGPLSTQRYRISVKIEPNGAAGTYLRERIRLGDALDISSRAEVSFCSPESGRWCCSARESGRRPFWRCCTRWRGLARHGRSCGCTRLAIGSIIRLPTKFRRLMCAPNETAAATFVTAGLARATRGARTSMRPVTSPRSVFNEVGLPRDADVYFAGHLASWRT